LAIVSGVDAGAALAVGDNAGASSVERARNATAVRRELGNSRNLTGKTILMAAPAK
jgi:hypothetical protein